MRPAAAYEKRAIFEVVVVVVVGVIYTTLPSAANL